jgi:hypothetical protein
VALSLQKQERGVLNRPSRSPKRRPDERQMQHALSANYSNANGSEKEGKNMNANASKGKKTCPNTSMQANRGMQRAQTRPLLHPHTNSAMQNRRCIEPGSSGPNPRCTSHLSYDCFLYEMHPQPYLIEADMEKYPLINHSLVSTIMS